MEEILKLLAENCRISVQDIAAITNKSVDEVQAIIKDCETKGIIRAYKTVIDWEKAGVDDVVYAFIDVKVNPERVVGFDDIAARIYKFPQVQSVHLVSGASDLRVVVSGKSIKDVALFVAEELATIDRVQSTSTHFLLKTYKADGIIFGDEEIDRRLAVSP